MAAEQKDHQQTIDIARRNWQAEVETAQTYRDLAERERDEKRKGILLRMAEAEERHAQRWEAKLKELGAEAPVYEETIGRRLNRWWKKTPGRKLQFAVWKQLKKGRKQNFTIKPSVRSRASRTFRNFCGIAQSKRKLT